MNANLYAHFAANFPQDKNQCCIETHNHHYYTWNDIERASAKIANLLTSCRLQPGARIAAHIEKSAEALILYLAVIRAGFIFIPFNTAYRTEEMRYFIQDAEPEVLICGSDNFGWLSQLSFMHGTQHVFTLDAQTHGANTGSLLQRALHHADTFQTVASAPEDIAAILYTSGTTGRSKGAMLSHHNLSSNAYALKKLWEWNQTDVLLHALPLFHVHGLFVACHGALLNGSKMIFLPTFDAHEVIQRLPQATIFMGVPTYYVRLLQDPTLNADTCGRMRLFISGSAPLLLDTFNSFIKRTQHTILERYGMSETLILTSNPYTGKRIGGTVGLPLTDILVRVAKAGQPQCDLNEIGDIQVKGPNVFKGYWRMPQKTAEEFTQDGYFRTGDVGKFDSNGYLKIVGRSKDLIISGGYNVYPKEIEMIIDDMPEVLESAVFGLPDKDFGEAVSAAIVLKQNQELHQQQVIERLKTKLANFKVVKKVFIVTELPRNAMGKVQKNLLRQRYQQLL